MGRPVMLGNGSLTVGLNEHGLVHDFYYPYVGLDNLTTSRSVHHLVGVWVEDQFSWVDDGSWTIDVNFESDAMVSVISMQSQRLGVTLQFNDFVDPEYNALCRQITVTNNSQQDREIRLFMHQVFQISSNGRGDTALYEPDENYILDYKGRCSLLIFAQDETGKEMDQYAVGSYGIEGKEGTFKDAEDGQLSGSAVEHGGVDSVVRLSLQLDSNQKRAVDYWIVAADSQFSAEKTHITLKKEGLSSRLTKVRQYWHEWLAIGSNAIHGVDAQYLVALKKSMMLIKVHTDRRGGIIASGDSSIYNYNRDYYSYVWPRDGAYAMWPLIRLGYTEEPKKFFEFCRDTISPEGYLMHKYQPDRALGSTWHPMLHNNQKELPIQEDETAIVLYMLGEYHDYSHDTDFVHGLYDTFIKPAANFMTGFIDEQTGLPHASYDLWEQKFLTHTYTVAVVYQALLVCADLATKFEFPDDAALWATTAERILTNNNAMFDPERRAFRKGFLLQADGSLEFDNVLDVSSMYGVMMYGYHKTTDQLKDTIHLIEQELLDISPSGGTTRYEGDNYFASQPFYKGNPWIITTLWMAQYYVRTGSTDKARGFIDWTLQHAYPSGVLSEQINPSTGQPVSVAPLVWSHAELVNTVLDVSKLG